MMKKAVFVIGPTASGKSGFSVQLAKEIGAEIISADSMQIYRGLDIGTAKITEDEMQGVHHHMLDIVRPLDDFSVKQYQTMARTVIRSLQEQDVTPIITGGTGLYIQSLLFNLDFSETAPDPVLRDQLQRLSDEELYQRLSRLDPPSAREIHPRNRRRMIRALEILASGAIPSRDRFDTPAPDMDAIVLGLDVDRATLHERISLRVDQMLKDGLIEECRRELYPDGMYRQAAAAIGYAETLAYLRGLCTREELRENIIVHTRQYAKRQMTWFRRIQARWIPYDTDPHKIAKELV